MLNRIKSIQWYGEKKGWRIKILKRDGVSIGEMLVAIIIMSLLTSVVASGTAAAGRVYRQSISYSESRVLTNSVISALEDELRYARDCVQNSDGSLTYTSQVYGQSATLSINNGIVVVKDTTNDEDKDNIYPLLGQKAYTSLHLKPVMKDSKSSFLAFDESNGIVAVSFTIEDSSQHILMTIENLYVGLLNAN